VIWSIIPESVIFSGETKDTQLRAVTYQGRRVIVRAVGGRGSGEIVSLLSTDPADFLSPCFMPGTVIDVR
jgi:hypothetical protein